uniref:Putative secreted protein n=1 Tax=Anopheles triannulatus TaxID=58253 RepID=A0A2M4B4N3_9DIPT
MSILLLRLLPVIVILAIKNRQKHIANVRDDGAFVVPQKFASGAFGGCDRRIHLVHLIDHLQIAMVCLLQNDLYGDALIEPI